MLDSGAAKLKAEVATTLYRVVQESLNNIEKHAQATKGTVFLKQFGDVLQLMISDNGIGFDVGNAMNSRGIGLRNMRERVEFIGGEFELFSEYGKGTEITVLLKVEETV